jgi:hypothetical protein
MDQGSANDTIIIPLDATVLGSLPAIDNSVTIDVDSGACMCGTVISLSTPVQISHSKVLEYPMESLLPKTSA